MVTGGDGLAADVEWKERGALGDGSAGGSAATGYRVQDALRCPMGPYSWGGDALTLQSVMVKAWDMARAADAFDGPGNTGHSSHHIGT